MFKSPWPIACLLLSALAVDDARAAQRLAGPVAALIVRVIDGDTLLVEAMPWPDQTVTTYVRLRGIDAPELKSRCGSDRRQAERSKQALSALTTMETRISLKDISGDKYFGRVVALVTLADGRDVSTLMLEGGLAEPYAGGRKRKATCG